MLKKVSKKKLINKKNILIGIIFLTIIVGIFIFKNKNGENQNTHIVKIDTVSDKLVFAGVIDAENRVDLGFAVSGRISKNYFKEGDFVKGGQVIAELDQNTLMANLIQANANYTLTRVDTEASVGDVEDSYATTLEQQNIFVEGLRQQYLSGDLQAILDEDSTSRNLTPPTISGNYNSSNGGTYNLEIYSSAARSGFSYKLSGLEYGTYTGEINQPGKLGEFGLYIQFEDSSAYKNTEWEIEIPNTRSSTYLSRKTAYENALASRESILTTAENNRDWILATDSQTNVSRSEAQINNARAQVNSVYSKLADGKIRAPFSGFIVKNDLEVGEMINAFETPVILFENNIKKLVLNTPEIYINKIKVGDLVSVYLDAYPEVLFEGVISIIDSIDTLVDGVPVYQTEVKIINEDERLRVGMNAHASIVISQKEDVLAIPQHFIKYENGISSVVVLNVNGDTEEHIIETGLKGNNSLIEVIYGLSLDDVIVFKK